jgi:hypothetical protein
MGKLAFLWLAIKTVLCNCNSDHKLNHFTKSRAQYSIQKIGHMPDPITESSGLARSINPEAFWTHNDSGGKNEIYEVTHTGQLLNKVSIPDSRNIDWEDLAQDTLGHLYIGDIGNNSHNRNDLTIYKYNQQKQNTEKITLKYSKQNELPTNPKTLSFDCEAFFFHQDSLYLFSKNIHNKNPFIKLYQLPAQPGDYQLTPKDSIQINSPITAADISPDGSKFVLLSYGKILLFDIAAQQIDFSKPIACFRMVRKQAEAILFINNQDLIVTNEQGEIFKITRR